MVWKFAKFYPKELMQDKDKFSFEKFGEHAFIKLNLSR